MSFPHQPPHSARQYAAVLDIRPLADRHGVRASGEVCLPTYVAWERALDELVGHDGDVHLELSAITYVDVAGATAMAAAAGRLGEGRRMVLHRPPQVLRRTLQIFWPGLTAIEVTPC
ncbi:STAS domain-containing protein [Streptomyces sp. NBC_01537]|uniref:STAS domain-containing protein n=1 Tax=Streptomyces sp. NBC_01537 TaxID=2903896 RepID=UPI00386E06AD